MISVPLAQAKKQLSELVSRAARGDTVIVTRRGQPVAKLVACNPDAAQAQQAQVGHAFARLRELRRGVELPGDVKALARDGLD
jgi:prevent-host-death family protein